MCEQDWNNILFKSEEDESDKITPIVRQLAGNTLKERNLAFKDHGCAIGLLLRHW